MQEMAIGGMACQMAIGGARWRGIDHMRRGMPNDHRRRAVPRNARHARTRYIWFAWLTTPEAAAQIMARCFAAFSASSSALRLSRSAFASAIEKRHPQ